jgi:ABC-2 type transport system ATP-binding protein
MSQPILCTQNLSKAYGRHQILRDVNFEVYPGSLVGIVGENGAGKSTLLRILAGEARANGGKVIRSGRFGYCPQNVVLNEALTVYQHLLYFKAAYNLSDLRRAEELLEELGYEQYRQSLVATLSGGTRQKLNLTLALMHQPQMLLLDEPYQGFDWETYLRFWELAEKLKEQGCAVLIISHMFFEQSRFDELYRLDDALIQKIKVIPEAGPVFKKEV